MSENIRCWVFGHAQTIINWSVARLFSTENITSDDQLDQMLQQLNDTQKILIVLLDEFADNDLCLKKLETSPNVVRVFVTYDSLPRNLFSQKKFIHLSLNCVVTHMMYDLIYLYCELMEHYTKSKKIQLEHIMKNKIRLLYEWTLSESKFEISHILLVPLNTEKTNLRSAQAEILELYSGAGFGSDLVVKTLQELTDLNDADQSYRQQRLIVKKINDAVQHILTSDYGPPIVLFLMGNLENSCDHFCLRLFHAIINKYRSPSQRNKCFIRLIANCEIHNPMAQQWIRKEIQQHLIESSRDQIIQISSLNTNQAFNSALSRSFENFHERSREASTNYLYNIVMLMNKNDDVADSGNLVNAPYESRRDSISPTWNIDQIIANEHDNQ